MTFGNLVLLRRKSGTRQGRDLISVANRKLDDVNWTIQSWNPIRRGCQGIQEWRYFYSTHFLSQNKWQEQRKNILFGWNPTDNRLKSGIFWSFYTAFTAYVSTFLALIRRQFLLYICIGICFPASIKLNILKTLNWLPSSSKRCLFDSS